MTAKRAHPGLTIRVYRINPVTGGRTTVKERTELTPADEPAITGAWPACTCPDCRPRRH